MREEAFAELRRVVEVIERLRAPGGCPSDRQQTHESLAPFLPEEAYEALQAIDRHEGALHEELDDLLLPVAHALGDRRRHAKGTERRKRVDEATAVTLAALGTSV